MGRLAAQDMAAHAPSLEVALGWHLGSNHYPPLPSFFIPTCVAAIEAGNDEDWDREIPLPRFCAVHQRDVAINATECVDGPESCDIQAAVTWKDGRDVVRAGDLIESFHLDSFLDVDEYAEEP